MKKITLALALVLLACGSILAQKTATGQRAPTAQRKPAIKQVEVSVETVSRQPVNKAYSIDLTRKGTIYNLASGVDYGRVRVRTTKGVMTVAELIQKSGKTITGPVRVGMTNDIRAQRLVGASRPGLGGGGLRYDCGDLACGCTGDDDCNDMFESGKCGLIAVCYPDGCICIRI
jgi:hypothetical protein